MQFSTENIFTKFSNFSSSKPGTRASGSGPYVTKERSAAIFRIKEFNNNTFVHFLTLKMKSLPSFATPATTDTRAQRNITEDRCHNLKSHIRKCRCTQLRCWLTSCAVKPKTET
jgi:hypothetical protein